MTKDTSEKTVRFQVGSLEVFIATTEEQVRAAQALRYRVFCEEMGARPSPQMLVEKRDFDEFDDICDHMLVVDRDVDKVVGTYRMLRRSRLPAGRKFYTESEYAISNTLADFEGEVMELGRSCVDRAYRTRSTMQLLWRGIGETTAAHDVKLLFGCASFPGSNHKMHATHLAYLYHYHLAPKEFRPRALEALYSPMNLIPKENIDKRECLTSLPPLIKGYLRLGGFVGDGAFEDKVYNTTDVCIVLKTDLITEKYQNRYVKPISE